MADTMMTPLLVSSHTWKWTQAKLMSILRQQEASSNLLYEWLVKEIRATDAKVQNVYFFQDGIVESVQKPGRVRDLEVVQR